VQKCCVTDRYRDGREKKLTFGTNGGWEESIIRPGYEIIIRTMFGKNVGRSVIKRSMFGQDAGKRNYCRRIRVDDGAVRTAACFLVISTIVSLKSE